MRVKWQANANRQREQVAEYVRQEFGTKYKKQFLQRVRQTTEMLKRSPNIGQIDSLFDARTHTYRSVIINGLSKLVYRIEDNIIHIVAFWDTRMEPEGQAGQVE